MKAISIKQPWSNLIVSGIKDIENRTWRTKFRGRVYVHASQAYDPRHRDMSSLFTYEQFDSLSIEDQYLMVSEPWVTSAIIGEVDIVDCVLNHPSVWAEHETVRMKDDIEVVVPIWNWILANPVKYDQPIQNVNGKLSFWEYERMGA